MSNFYSDNKEIEFFLQNMDLSRVVDLKEDSFAEKKKYKEAPANYLDALDNYKRVLSVVGEIAGEYIAVVAPEVDRLGARWENGEVFYAPGTKEAIKKLKQADLLGFTLPRKYEGINMPKIIYSMAIELISRADASLMNIFGLQEISDTIFRFGSQDQRDRYLPRFARGEVLGSMALTEPDAGSDLQAVMIRAYQGADGAWKLNGVKRFITNGHAHISLVLARSEDSTTDGRGLSLFIYERDKNLKIRRIEHKLGIKGSPTCELQFNDASCELLGTRKMGLIKYTMSLMNGARLGVSAQAVGIAEAAFREAKKYAGERKQFKKTIDLFAPVKEMLLDMESSITAGRALLYETSKIVDLKEGLEEKVEHYPQQAMDLKDEIKKYTKLASLFTPLCKAYNTEMCNKVAYDAIQIHGGVGFTTEFNVERHYRDARITNIYEGTTQLQVVAAISGVTSGVVFEWLNEYEQTHADILNGPLFEKVKELRAKLENVVSKIKLQNDLKVQDQHARRLVDISADVINSYLMLWVLSQDKNREEVVRNYILKASARIFGNIFIIENML